MREKRMMKKRIVAVLLTAVVFFSFIGAGTLTAEENDLPVTTMEKEEPVETIVLEEETIRDQRVIDDGNIYIVDAMVKIAEGGSLEIRNGALIVQKGIKIDGDILVSSKGILINEGVIGGTVTGQTRESADFRVAVALGTDAPDNILNAESGRMEHLVVGGMTKITNMGTISSVVIDETLEGIFNNEALGVIDEITVYTQKDVVGNTGKVTTANVYGSFWNGDRGHVDTAHAYDGGVYCNHDGATTKTVYIHGGTVNNHQGYPTNLNEFYDKYELACIDTVILDVRNEREEENLQNGGYIRTLTARNGVVYNYGCIDYAFISAEAAFRVADSETFWEEYNKHMQEHPEESEIPFANAFPDLMDRNGIYWELNGCTTEFKGKIIVKTLCVNGCTLKNEALSLENLFLVGKTGVNITLTDPLEMLSVGESVRFAQINGEDISITHAGICGSVPLSTTATVEEAFIPEANGERVGRYFVGTSPLLTLGAEAGTPDGNTKNTTRTAAEVTDGFQKDFYKRASTGLWYAIDCEKFTALNVNLCSSAMGVAMLYTPEGEVVVITSTGEEVSAGLVSEMGGTYYLRIFGGSGQYSIGLQKTDPLQISYEISRCSTDGRKSIIQERSQEYLIALYNQTQGRELTGMVNQDNRIFVSPDQVQVNDTVVAKVHNVNGKNADTEAEFVIPSSYEASFRVEVVPRGRFVVTMQDTREVSGYLYNAAGAYQETLEKTKEGFVSSYLEAGSYQAVFVRDGSGIYKFPAISSFAENGMTAGKDYLLCSATVEDGADTKQTIQDMPDSPSATHPALKKEDCIYIMESGNAVANAMVQTTLRYAFMEETAPTEIWAQIQLNEGTTVVEGSVAVDGEIVEYTMEEGILCVPLKNVRGTVCFYLSPSGISDAMVSTARLRFLMEGKENLAIIGSASVSVTNLSVNAPEYTSETTLRLWGYGPVGEELVLLDNREEICRVVVDRRGFWSQEVTLPENAEAGIHTLCAVCGNISSKTTTLRVADAVPKLVNFTMYYMYHDAMQKMEIPGELMGAAPLKFEYMPGTDFTFSMHMTENERIDRLFVNALMDGEIRTMEAFYRENTGRWDAVGRFSDDAGFVPSGFTVTYIRKTGGNEEKTVETATTSDTEAAWFSDAAVTVSAIEENPEQIGYLQELLINLYGAGEVPALSIPATYSYHLESMENPKEELERRGFTLLGKDEGQHDVYILLTKKDDFVEAEIARIVPEIEQVKTCQYFYSLLRDALIGGVYNDELAQFDISDEVFEGYLSEREEVLDTLDYVETAVNDYKNALLDGTQDSFLEEFGQKLDTQYYPTPMSLVPDAGFGNAVMFCKFGMKAAFNIIDLAGKLQAVDEQTKDYVEWKEAQATMDTMLDIMNDISSSEYAWAMNREFTDAQTEFERAQKIRDQKAETMKNRLCQVLIGTALDPMLGSALKKTTTLFSKGGSIAFKKGMKDVYDAFSDLNQYSKDSSKLAVEILEKATKDNKYLNDLLKPLLKEADMAELVDELLETGLSEAIDELLTNPFLEKIFPTEGPEQPEDEVEIVVEPDEWSEDEVEIVVEPDEWSEDEVEIVVEPDDLEREDMVASTPADPAIDPSGYVYEAVETNRIANVKATVYWKDDKKEAVMWEAGEYGQENPLFTNEEGCYEWFVPAGDWRVEFEKEGYDTLTTEWLPVPPPQTEVNVGMISHETPRASAYIHKGSVDILFDRYMVADEVEKAEIRLVDGQGREQLLKPVARNPEQAADGSGVLLANTFQAKVDGRLRIGKNYQISIPGGLTGYAGVATTDTVTEVVCTPDIKEIDCEDELLVESDGEVKIPIRIHADGKVSDIKLSCESKQRGFVRILNVGDVRFTGFCVITIQTDRIGTIPVTITAEGTDYSKTIKVTVLPKDQKGEKGKTFLKAGNHPVDGILLLYLVSAFGILLIAIIGVVLLKRNTRHRRTASSR